MIFAIHNISPIEVVITHTLANHQLIEIMKYLFFFLFIPLTSLAQDIDYAPHSISINVLSLFSPYHGNLNISYEYRFSERIAVEVGVAPIFPLSYATGHTGRKADKGLILRVEPKVFLANWQEIDTVRSLVVSSQLFFTYHSYIDIQAENWDSDTYHRSHIKNLSLGIIPQVGYHRSGGGYAYEFSTGFGSKWISVINDNVSTNPKLAPRVEDQFFYHKIPGWMRQNILNFNVKLGGNFSLD